MRLSIVVAALLLAGCKSSADVRVRNLYAQADSTRSVSDLAGCIALAVSGSGIEVAQEPLPTGVSVTASMRVVGVKTVLNVFDIVDTGPTRRISFYAVGTDETKSRALPPRIAACM